MTRKAVLSGSGRGGEKRPGNGTSLAAYFIVWGLNSSTAPIYRVLVKEIRWEAVFPNHDVSIPMIGADFLHFISKSVEV